MIIQTIAILDQLDKDINTFSMRIRSEKFSYLSLDIHFVAIFYKERDSMLGFATML